MADDPFVSAGLSALLVNFQDSATADVAGYFVDNFLGFADRGSGFCYGWVTEATGVPIDSAIYPDKAISERSGGIVDTYDPRLTGFAHFDLDTYPAGPAGDGARVAWEVQLPPGWYEVTASVGDVAGPTGGIDNRLFIEGVSASGFQPTPEFRTELVTRAVEVTDGFLTLSSEGGTSSKIQYVEVRPLEDLTPADGLPAQEDYANFREPRAVAQDGSEVFQVDLAPMQGFAEGVDPEANLFLGVSVADGRGGVALESLGDGSFRVIETLTGVEVPISVDTTAAGDSITIETPDGWKPFTSYTLIVDGAQDRGANDSTDGPRPFQQFSTTFLTGDSRAAADRGVAFTDSLQIDGAEDNAFAFASVELAPDGHHLYVSTLVGEIIRWELDPTTGDVLSSTREVFTPGGDFETADGRRGIIGLAVDPDDENIIWVTDDYPIPLSGRNNEVPDFSGRVSKVTLGAGGDLATATIETYLTGLPRSNGDHATNGLRFRDNPDYDPVSNPDLPPHLLYVTQGSNTGTGGTDSAWGFRPERLLSAAVLEIDPTRTPPAGGFDVTTEPLPADGLNRRFADSDGDLKNGGILIDSGPFTGNYLHFDGQGIASVREGADASSALLQEFYNPFAPGAVLTIYGEGVRNAYDLLWHSNGNLYLPANGSAAGGAVPDDPTTPSIDEALTDVPLQPDLLLRVSEGGYYGHANPLRDHYVLNGGNPTAGLDPFEVVGPNGYPEGVVPDGAWDPAELYSLGASRSPNGVIEYSSPNAASLLQNAIIVAEYSGGNTLRALILDGSGGVMDDFVLRDYAGAVIDTYADPLDLALDADTGRIYGITLNRTNGESKVFMFDPTAPAERIEAEDLTVENGFVVNGSVNASGSGILQAGTGDEQRANFAFDLTSGVYNVGIGHFDENDGVASLALFVNDVAVDAFPWDQDFGSSGASPESLTERVIGGVFIQNGDVVEIRGYRDGGEPLRIDYLDFSFVDDVVSGSAPANTAPAAAMVTANETLDFNGGLAVSVADSDSMTVTTSLTVSHGSIALGTTDATLFVTDGGSTTTISGTIAEVNDALAGLSFTPTAGYVGSAAIDVATSDGSQADVDTIDVTVEPFGDPAARISAVSLDPGFFENRLHFNYIDNPSENSSITREFKSSGTVEVANDGTSPLDISGFQITGPFKLADPGQLTNVTLQPGAAIQVQVDFDRANFTPTPNGVNGVFEGALEIFSNDQDSNVTTIELAGFWQNKDEGGWEANVNEVWEVFGFGTHIDGLPFQDGGANPLATGGLYAPVNADEVMSPYFRIADGVDEAQIVQMARFSGPTGETVAVHRPSRKGAEALEMLGEDVDSQTILPRTASGFIGMGGTLDPIYQAATFTNETIPDNWAGDEIFGFRLDNFSSDPALNTLGNTPADPDATAVYGHWTRIFQARDGDGVLIPNAYLLIEDQLGVNEDFNDIIAYVTGVTPVSNPTVNTAPMSIEVAEDGIFAFTAADTLSVDDPDGTALTDVVNVYLQVGDGTLSVASTADVTVSGDDTGFVTLTAENISSGRAIDLINTALASLTYAPNPNFSGSDTLRIVSNDGALADEDFVAIAVTEGDDDAPVVASVSAPVVQTGGGTTIDVTVNYSDDVALDLSSIDAGDVRVLDPFGADMTVLAVAVSASDAMHASAVYTVEARGGAWDATDNGTYQVLVQAGEVLDDLGASVAAGSGGVFDVAIPAPMATRIEAESLSVVSGFVVAGSANASGGQVLQAGGSGEQRAQTVFAGEDGTYSVSIGHFDENDGMASMSLLVNGGLAGSWVWDQDLGSAFAAPETLSVETFADVGLTAGDLIEIVGFKQGGEPLRTDYLDFLKTSDTVPPPPPPPPAEPFRIEAESLSVVSGFVVADSANASAGQILQAGGSGEQRAQTVFAGDDGTYTVSIGHFDENDGMASMDLLVNGALAGSWVWDEELGSALATEATLTEETFTEIGLTDGDLIEIVGFKQGGEPLRTDYLEFLKTDDSVAPPPPPPPPEPFRVEAEDLDLSGGFVVKARSSASGGANIETFGAAEAVASHAFTGQDGVYDVGIGYFDENDGVAQMRVLVNDVEVDAFDWDAPGSFSSPQAGALVTHVVEGVELHDGDIVDLRAFADDGEPVRTDFVDFTYVADLIA